MRYHELALQRWLNSRFFVGEGYPVPCVFAMPMAAFSEFTRLWQASDNPFTYLLQAKDDDGTPLYEPYPAPLRYPLLSVVRKPIVLRKEQNFSLHNWKRVNWPTVSDTGTTPIYGRLQNGIGLTKCDLGNVTVNRMPMGMNFPFNITYHCMRPDTQALFHAALLKEFWRSSATLQTWIEIDYPGWGTQYVRAYIDGDTVDHSPPDESAVEGKSVELTISFTLVIEGFMVDVDYRQVPALWSIRSSTASPEELDQLFYPPLFENLRAWGENPVMAERHNVPSSGTCAVAMRDYGALSDQHVYFGDPNQPANPPINWDYTPTYSYGIPSQASTGTLTLST